MLVVPRSAAAWTVQVNGPASGADIAYAVATDRAGNILSAGSLSGNGFSYFTVIKHSSAGVEMWRTVIGSSSTNAGSARAIAVDPAGDVIAAGVFGANTNFDFFLVKLARTTGSPIWQVQIDAPAHRFDQVRKLAVDDTGDVTAVGDIAGTGANNADFFVARFAGSTGTEIWRYQLDQGQTEAAHAVAVDPATNDAIVAGIVGGAGGQFTVVRLESATGAQLWKTEIGGSGFDVAVSVAIDSMGNVAAAGQLATPSPDFSIVKLLGADGALLWRRDIDGSLNSIDAANAVAVDSNDDIVVAGQVRNSGTSYVDSLAIARLNGGTGTPIWFTTVNGRNSQMTPSLALDGADDAVASTSLEVGTGGDFAVLKFSSSTGTELWRAVMGTPLTSEESRAVAVDDAGDVIAAGHLTGATTGVDFAVVKRSGSSGGDFIEAAPGRIPFTMTVLLSTVTSGSISISWLPSCASPTDYSIYEGILGNYYSHTLKDCSDDDGDLVEELSPAPFDSYYLIVPRTVRMEGSYGTDSAGAERPVGVLTCVGAQLVHCP